MKKHTIIWCLLLILTANSCTSKSGKKPSSALNDRNTLTGKVIGIIDGDTYDVSVEGSKIVRVRMEGIDAPERGMPFYNAAKNYLATLCLNKVVRLKVTDTDSRGRYIANTFLADGTELGQEMIKAGLAWHFKNTTTMKRWQVLNLKPENSRKAFGF
jgi:micrococcal nuclease